MNEVKFFRYPHPYRLESGETLPELTVAYHTYGRLDADRSNAVWVMHALTANSDVADWWPHTVETGKFLDPSRYFVVCANVLGSCYGTTGPLSVNHETGEPWYGDFPDVTVRDMVECHRLLAGYLGITHIDTIIGSSLGGFQALEWLTGYPDVADKAVLIATDVECRPWEAAINESMYMAMRCDPTLGERRPDAGAQGLAAARSIALLSYRSHYAYDLTQRDCEPRVDIFKRKVQSYQQYQGRKLVERFNAYSYLTLCRSADAHDISRGRGSMADALSRIKARCLVVAISSDILFPPENHRVMADGIPHAEFHVIDSEYAHDGFLIEHEKLNTLISEFQQKE